MELTLGQQVWVVGNVSRRTVQVREAKVVCVNSPLTLVCVTDGGFTWFAKIEDVFTSREEAVARRKQLEEACP